MENIFESIENNYNKLKEEHLALKSERIADAFVGYIYVLVNPLFDMVKIGYAKDVEKRMKELSGSSMPEPYHCYCTYGVTETRTDLEVHSLIDDLDPDLRHSANREFYDISKERAYRILEAIAKISGTTNRLKLNPFNDEYFYNYTKDDNIIVSANKGVNIMKSEEKKYSKIPVGLYHNKKKTAFARVEANGNWTILKGSYACTKKEFAKSNSVCTKVQKTRWEHIKDNIFTEDVEINSTTPSASAEYIENQLKNGWEYWYTEDGIPINEAFPRT